MKMGKLHRKNNYFPIITFIIILVVFSSFLKNLLIAPFIPVGSWLTSIASSITEQVFWYTSAGAITPAELKNLMNQRESLVVDLSELERLKDENRELQDELGFVNRTNYEVTPARIVFRTISSAESTYLIDAGSEDGVKIGDAVSAREGIYVGKIVALGMNSATVQGVTDASLNTAVSLLNEGRTIGVANGIVGNLIEVKYIPMSDTISVNDIVVTSGLEQNIPSGLVVGIINAIDQDPSTLFLTAIVEPMINIRILSHVLVLTTPDL